MYFSGSTVDDILDITNLLPKVSISSANPIVARADVSPADAAVPSHGSQLLPKALISCLASVMRQPVATH